MIGRLAHGRRGRQHLTLFHFWLDKISRLNSIQFRGVDHPGKCRIMTVFPPQKAPLLEFFFILSCMSKCIDINLPYHSKSATLMLKMFG